MTKNTNQKRYNTHMGNQQSPTKYRQNYPTNRNKQLRGKKQMKKFDIQKETGITLIILVVTIVIVLILAAITVNLSINDSGIIKRAEAVQNDIDGIITDNENKMAELANKIAEGTIEGGSSLIPDANSIGEGGEGENDEQDTEPIAPRLEVTGTEGENHYYVSEVDVKVLANDRANNLTYTVEGTEIEQEIVSTETAIRNGQTIHITNDGTYTITAYAYNRNGKKSEGSTVTISKDTVAPTATLTVTKIENTTLTVRLLANDPEPSSKLAVEMPFTFYYQEVGTNNWVEAGKGSTSSYIYEGLKENASYHLKAEVKDTAGNIGTSNIVQDVQMMVDKTKPVITKLEGPTHTYLKVEEQTTYTIETSEPTKIVGTTENNSHIQLTGEGIGACQTNLEPQTQDAEGYATTYTLTLTAGNGNGAVEVSIQAGTFQDKAGNQNEDTKTQTGLTIDNTAPIMTITPETNSISKNTTLQVAITETGSGLHTDTTYAYCLSQDPENPTAEGHIEGTYEPNTPFTIGDTLTGTYYLFLKTIQDAIGNQSLETVAGYYKVGPYTFDNTAPTVTSVVTSNPKSKGFTISLQAEDNPNGSGLAEENTYHIYYKTSKATGYAAPITTTETIYTLDSLTPTIEDADITQDQANEPYLQEGMNPVIWVDLNENGTIEEATEEIVKYTNLESKTINPKWTANNGDNIWAVYNNCTVTYDVYVTATDKLGNTSIPSETIQQTITPPIDHKTSHFANVRMEEDGSYFTWIPRFAYKITEQAPSTETSIDNTGYIQTKFIKNFTSTAYDGTECTIATSNIDTTTQYVVHPAFCENVDMGGYGTNLSGIWVAKYESSMEKKGEHIETENETIGNVVSSEIIKVVSKPNVSSWRNIQIKNSYTNAYQYNRNLDSHMIKNSEWGAIAYLTHSQYGRNGNEVMINNCGNYITGNAGNTVDAIGVNDVTYTYNTGNGMLASTSGNIYGIYDLNGGAWETTASWNTEATNTQEFASGESFASQGGKSTKYATVYYNASNEENVTRENTILGDATYEVYLNPGRAWFGDLSHIPESNMGAYFRRGGNYSDKSYTGIFNALGANGSRNPNTSFRITIPGNMQIPTDGTYSDVKKVNTPQISGNLNPVMWIDKNGNGTIEVETEEIKKYTNMTTKEINPDWIEHNGDENWYDYTDNGQTLESKIDHKQSKWANVIDEDTGSYFVWIPRYAYKITPTTNTTPSETNAGMIDVQFVKNNTAETASGTTATIATSNIDSTSQYIVHPAFCENVNMGGYGTNLYGIWVAKYEASQEKDGVNVQTNDEATGNVTGENLKAVSKPGVSAWKLITVGNMFNNSYNYNRELDSHMLKNSEWGACAYLTHSVYGRNGNEVTKNADEITGGADYRKNTEQSTTGNITGIYDMNGYGWEFVAVFNNLDSNGHLSTNGWKDMKSKSDKYATNYASDKVDVSNTNCIIGDATYETANWFLDYGFCMNSENPFLRRGGFSGDSTGGGIFASAGDTGVFSGGNSFRVCLPGTGIPEKDYTKPVISVSPGSTEIPKQSVQATITITDPGAYSAGIAEGNSYTYFLSPSSTSPTAEGYVTGTYESGEPITIGTSLTGTYYLYIQQVFDKVGNKSIITLTEDGIGYYRCGPYQFDNTAPTVTSITMSQPQPKGFTINIQAEDNENGSGLADENTYAIYYKTSKATGYTAPITTAETTYTFDSLTPTIEDIDIIQDQANEPYLREGMNPVIWVDLNENGTIEESTEEIVKYSNLTNKTINPKWTENEGDTIWSMYNHCTVTYEAYVTATDKAGNVSEPSSTASQTIEPPIDHRTSHFANVKMEEDGSYFTWIPRYAYKITQKAPSTEPSDTNAGTIDVKFIKGTGNIAYDGTTCTIAKSNADKTPNNIDSTTQYIVHPAFCEDVYMGGYDQELEGIWVAKYESSQENTTNGITWNSTEPLDESGGNVKTTNAIIGIGETEESTKIRVVSKPNVASWRWITIGNCYTNGYYYNRALDSHLMKNSEWGAIAYLTHSQYGRNGNEISINDSSRFYTGRSKGSPITEEGVEAGTYRYNVEEGMLASTSGNIYGIYDLSGGASEYTASWDTKSTNSDALRYAENFAKTGKNSTKYETAYYNGISYDDGGYYPTSSNGILGDATYEVNVNPGSSSWAWFHDWSYVANASDVFFLRGGNYGFFTGAGMFYSYNYHGGIANGYRSFRMVIPGKQELPTDGSWSEEKGVNTPQVRGKLNPVMWVDKNGNGNIEVETEEIKKYSNINTKEINPEWEENHGDQTWYDYTSNGQTLNSKIDHKQSKWANVIDEDTGSYFVWIPRYAYKILPTKNSTPSENNAGSIDIKFVKNDTQEMSDGTNAAIATTNIDSTSQYIVHPAFGKDVNVGGYERNLYGMWVAKYEASQEKDGIHVQTDNEQEGNVVADTIKPVFKPNVSSWRNISVGNCYINAYQYNRDMDSHLMKNSEWGAIAYLTHSLYGRNGNEISINNNNNFLTGGGAYASDTMLQSTTGNITGVYDMSGGAFEYTATFNSLDNNGHLTNNGWGGLNTTSTSTRYATKYTCNYPSDVTSIVGDAMDEVYVGSNLTWFSDYRNPVNQYYPFQVYGGNCASGINAGIFSTAVNDGHGYHDDSFRVCLPSM